MKSDLEKFIAEFNIVDNALNMRNLVRWNGRDLHRKENLAEHTHLVVACAIQLLNNIILLNEYPANKFNVVNACMTHDSLEMLRGDVLSCTKDAFPPIRNILDDEESLFQYYQDSNLLSECEKFIVKLADLMACYKFLEKELTYPNNDFAKEVYLATKAKFDNALKEFKNKFCYATTEQICEVTNRFAKGYANDAGVDIILDRKVTFMPLSTTTIDLNVQIPTAIDTMSFLCARTSAANMGLSVATCPIDPGYTGSVNAIVHNVSNDIITYEAGTSFCQYVTVRILTNTFAPVKKEGVRTDSKLGGTDKC